MAASRQTRASWNKLIDDSDQPIWVVDAEWRIVLTNPALLAWWGEQGEQLEGQEIPFSSALAPDPVVFAGHAVQTFIDHPRDKAQRITVQWIPVIDSAGKVQAAWAWGTRVDPVEQSSPTKISATTDWPSLLAQHRARSRAQASLHRFVGESLAMQILRARAELAARQASHAWIVGPAGSGRRTLARTIRALNPAAEVPCAEWDAALLTPELLQRQFGEFAALNQARLLKTPTSPAADVLLLNAEQLTAANFVELKSLASKTPLRFLVTSTVAATEIPGLDQRSASLVAEWSALTIEIPPLAARLDDLPLLVQQLIEESNSQGSKRRRGCSLAALEMLAAYRWPGEVAELARVIRAAYDTATGSEIQPGDLPAWLRQAESALSLPRPVPQTLDLDQQLAEIERELLARALRLAGGNKTQAAKLVGWTRQRLLRRGEELGLLRPASEKAAANEPEFIPDLPFEPEE